MAEYKVKQDYIDRYTMELVKAGGVVELTDERAAEIAEVVPKALEAVKAAPARARKRTVKDEEQ